MKTLNEILSDAATEEEVKNFFAKYFKLKLSTKNFIDLYTPQILFEFKFDAPLKNLQVRAATVAQTLYYVRRLKFGKDTREVSQNICVVTKDAAIFFKTASFDEFIGRKTYDWDLAPSSPCKKLVADLAAHYAVKVGHVYDFSDIEDSNNFVELINHSFNAQLSLFAERKEINENNFYEIFKHWQKFFGDAVKNGHKPSEYFVTDIEDGKSSIIDGHSVLFRMSGGERIEKVVNLVEYKHFWSVYDKIIDPRAVIAIRQKMDRMTEINLRRFTGEFFTPIAFAEKAIDYLERVVGENWWRGGKFRLWDMAAGTGNLEFALPNEALRYCYISTLLDDDADYCRKIFPAATVFQYDYLNDDVNFFGHEQTLTGLGVKRKMPQKLVDDLANPELRWIIFINPPYATGNDAKRIKSAKRGVSETEIKKLMDDENLKSASRELFSQFLYRISKEFSARTAWLGMFSKLKYIRSEREKIFRDKLFSYKFERGFVFNSKTFHGCTGQFPVGFLIWNIGNKISLESQAISLDVYNSAIEKVAEKILKPSRNEELLNKWIDRPKQIKKFPPMSSALNFSTENKIIRADLVAEDFLASFMCVASDFSHQNFTTLLSAPYINPGAMSITPENFEQCMIVHMVRRLPKATWLNDRDQFMQPTKILSREFICDAVIWSLFAPSNQTVSLRDVEYEGEVYRMPNNFFPFALEELRRWTISDADIRAQIFLAHEDRFAALWLQKNRDELSAAAKSILNSARAVYKKFFAELATLDVRKFKITDWDAGWYQIRMSLGATIDLTELSTKLLPQIYELGFLRDEVKYF